ncbi:uncharacterized protein LOC117322486 [Pecten maximus]|uniref:uncharacterized protein LOC117322486 n=1 Tax=Pecten maximus TaxID=6579 RepID=UPI001458726F|nr:uncharacterized protein LOC117322486 [Pecten maximus]
MTLQSVLLILTTFALIQLTKALFYTSSKQNDFPRIGKRRNMYPSEAWPHVSMVSDPRRDMPYVPLEEEEEEQLDPLYNKEEREMPFTSRHEHQKPTTTFSNSMYYRILARNGYRLFSKDKLRASRDVDIQGTGRYY